MRNFRLRFFIVFVLLLSLVTGFSYVSGKYVMTTDSFNLNLDVKANFYVTFDANGGVLENPVESDDTWSIETENSKPIRATKVYMPKNACYSDKEPQAIGTIPSVSRYGYNFLGWSFANVPYGYQEVEYLTSDGNQYIDLPYGFNSTDEIEIKAALDNISQDKYLVAKKSWTSNDRFLMVGGFSGFGIGYGDKPTNATDFVTKINQTVSKDKNVHTWTYANKVFKITDLNVEIDVSSSNFSENETSDIRLFYGYYSNTAGTIYSFHQKKADGREIKLVPAEWSGGKTTYSKNNVTYENSELAEGTLGLYDKTNGMFYINSGKGTFTRGKYVNSDNEDDEFINASSILEDATDYIFYASWQKKSYTVTLYNNDETGSTRAIGNENGSQINVNYGETYYKLPNVSRTGYEFKGWFDIDGKEYIKDEIVDIEEDIDLYAKWLANTYTVSLDAVGGEIDSKTKNIKFDDKYGELPTPTRKGYDFLGWLESRVPLSFEELEYISSTGNGQYIELPFGFDSTDEIKLTAAIDLSGDRYIVAPAKWNNNNNRFALGGVYQGLYTIGYGNYSTSLTHLGPTHTIDANKHLWTYKDYLFEMPELNLSFDVSNVLFGGTTDKIRLFFGYNSPMSGKIYSYYHKKVVNGKEEEINLVPIEWKGGNVVYSKNGTETKGELPSGTVGFYDTLNDVLYINSGSNTLTGGDAVKPLTDYVLENTLMSIPNNHALIADWTPHKYNLTFDANGGTITYPSETDDVWKEVSNTSVTKYIRIEEKYGELPTVSKTGYSFEGWYNAQSKNEYFVLDYIQSDGTQIINTGYKPTNKTSYEIKYSDYKIPTANSEHRPVSIYC